MVREDGKNGKVEIVDHRIVRTRSKRRVRSGTILVVACAVLVLASCSRGDDYSAADDPDKAAATNGDGGDDSAAPGRYTADDPEYKAAAIGGELLTEANIDDYAAVLDSLEAKCSNERIRLTDMAVVSRDLITDRGGEDLTLLGVLEAADDSIPSGSSVQPCENIFTALVVLVTS